MAHVLSEPSFVVNPSLCVDNISLLKQAGTNIVKAVLSDGSQLWSFLQQICDVQMNQWWSLLRQMLPKTQTNKFFHILQI